MIGASYPKFARKLLELHTINKAPLKHAHDDEVSKNGSLKTRRAKSDMVNLSGASTPNAAHNGMDFGIMHTRMKP